MHQRDRFDLQVPGLEGGYPAEPGASAARNHALSLAQGDYIQWLDSDDVLAPDKVAEQMREAEPGNASRTLLSGAWGFFFDDPGKTRFIPNPLWDDLKPAEWLYRKLDQNLWMAIETWLVSRKLTEMADPWNEKTESTLAGSSAVRRLSGSYRFLEHAFDLE